MGVRGQVRQAEVERWLQDQRPVHHRALPVLENRGLLTVQVKRCAFVDHLPHKECELFYHLCSCWTFSVSLVLPALFLPAFSFVCKCREYKRKCGPLAGTA